MPDLRSPGLALEVVAPGPHAPRPLDSAELLSRLFRPLEGAPHG